MLPRENTLPGTLLVATTAMAGNMPGSALIEPRDRDEADVQDHIFRLSKDGVRILPHPSHARRCAPHPDR